VKLRWTPQAVAELEEIRDYLERERPAWTSSTMRRLYEVARSVKAMPHRGRMGDTPGTRELPSTSTPFITVYRVTDAYVEILGFRHAAQDIRRN
jgi:plasmid stabilization system protein ParE